MQRRDFIISGLSLSAVAYLLGLSEVAQAVTGSATGIPYLVLSDTDANKSNAGYVQDKHAHTATDVPGKIVFKNLKTGALESFDVPIWAHVFNQNPKRPNIFLGSAKWTPTAVVFDYKTKKNVATIKAPEDYRFFGHACYSLDGKYAYLTAHSILKKNGALCVYNCDDWTLQKMVDSGGIQPHELIITPNNQVCVINPKSKDGTSPGNLSFFDATTLKSLNSVSCPSGAHIVFMDDSRVVSGGHGAEGEVILFQVDIKTKKVTNIRDSKMYPEKKILSEALSVYPLSKDFALATLPDRNQLIIWNPTTNDYKIIEVPEGSLGLARIDNKMFLNCQNTNELMEFKVADDGADITRSPKPESHIGNGRHMRLVYI